MSNNDKLNLVTQSIPMDSPIIDLLIYQRLNLQVQPNNKDELSDQKYNTKDRYLLTLVGVKWLLLSQA